MIIPYEKKRLKQESQQGIKLTIYIAEGIKSKVLGRITMKRIYNTVVRPVLRFGAEPWTPTVKDKNLLKRKKTILCKIYGAITG